MHGRSQETVELKLLPESPPPRSRNQGTLACLRILTERCPHLSLKPSILNLSGCRSAAI